MLRTIDIDLTLRPTIEAPPQQLGNLYDRACSGDGVTCNSWRETWVKQYKLSSDRFGSFKDRSIARLQGLNTHKPCIVVGSGPSLKYNIEALKENILDCPKVPVISCLHNFGYFDDNDFHANYYLSLDAGDIVIRDVFEGRDKPAEHYWEQTKGKTLLAYVCSPPELFDKWLGDVYLFNCLIPDEDIRKRKNDIQVFRHYSSTGGNALGASFYVAKAILGSDPIIFVGADFCFDYNNQFHAYKTHYDEPGQCMLWPDIWGVPRKTWPSYLNFKFWFDHTCVTVPGNYISCSEGILGSYQDGNIKHFKYMSLKEALLPYKIADHIFVENRSMTDHSLISKEKVKITDMFADGFEKDLCIF